MIVTEREAKTKQCQETFSTVEWHYCIGSSCMAWRWRRESLFVPTGDNLFEEHVDKGDLSTTHGYCGKAGKP